MSSSLQDFQLANAAAGFTVGFGIHTVWKAIKQTSQLKHPWRSRYIYIVWGEITANTAIAILAWLFLNNFIPPSVPTYFIIHPAHLLMARIVLFWAFEIQLILQLIINRIYVVAECRVFANNVKWTVAGIITFVNISVFCIFIPAHLVPPPHPLFVQVNKYWDKTTKFIILIIDAALNWYFLRTVKLRLVKHSGQQKYRPLLTYNSYLMVISISMDLMIIGLMFLHDQLVFMQFHPVAYMVKLNIEMTMARLIAKIATSRENDFKNSIKDIPTFLQYRPASSNDSEQKVMKNKNEDERPIVVTEEIEIHGVVMGRSQNTKYEGA